MSTDSDQKTEGFEGHNQTRAGPWVRRFFGFFGIMTENSEADADRSHESE